MIRVRLYTRVWNDETGRNEKHLEEEFSCVRMLAPTEAFRKWTFWLKPTAANYQTVRFIENFYEEVQVHGEAVEFEHGSVPQD